MMPPSIHCAMGPFEQRSPVPRGTPPIPAEVLQSFAAANAARWVIDGTRLHPRVPVQLRSRAHYTGPTQPDDPRWADMHDGGFPGSPADGRTALVFVRLYCGGMCAWETYFLMSRSDEGRWMVTRQYVTSQS